MILSIFFLTLFYSPTVSLTATLSFSCIIQLRHGSSSCHSLSLAVFQTDESVSSQRMKIPSFKDEFTFEQRLEESREIIAKYPNRVPVIVERYSRTNLPDLEKKKFMVPRDMTVGQFIHVLSNRLHLDPGKALFVFVNNTLPQTASFTETLYESFKDEDGFLYMCYSTEKTFGSNYMQQ